MGKIIDINGLTPGMVIIRVTRQNGPVRIRKTGLVTSQAMVQGLIEMGIQEVEIDPEQTVEVEREKTNKSATRQMLESNNVTNTRIDDGLSDHFHRSLFLPSVQDIPSAWLFYTKRYATAGLIAIAGFGLGWALSHYKEIQATFVAAPLVEIQPEQTTTEVQLTDVENEALETPKDIETETETSTIDTTQTDAKSAQPDTPKPEQIPEQAPQVVSSQAPEPEIQPQPVAAEEPAISADLLARFREAVSEVGDEPVETEVQKNTAANGVSRIEQLPVWVLTELPSMSFSAHMYASDDAERWVRVNGARMQEGDMIDGKVEIISISPQMVVLSYQGHEFSMDALTDW
ncbi:general secretion pathway protein GspB [Paraglaciecola sp. 2405UD69-4]|uniref:general secretion pathway protein GspB n=1 Tax=Paraglaciecola sp. 2405UD69-4 TaxID=3391836 RepID=UPI0039C926AB